MHVHPGDHRPLPIITLSTDFGGGGYVAQMKGVILSRMPEANIVDISHEIPPQDIVAGSLILADVSIWFPKGTIHVAVVDPGVGTDRNLVYAEVGDWRYLVPDNGLLGPLLEVWPLKLAVRLTNREFWLQSVTPTFHGRDILASVAVHVARGIEPHRFGPITDELAGCMIPAVLTLENGFQGEIIAVDSFGNLISNVKTQHFGNDSNPMISKVMLQENSVNPRWVKTYGQQESGTYVALFGSSGRLEIAQVDGNAAQSLGIGKGAKVSIVSLD